MGQVKSDKDNEFAIVASADAIVKPETVMVESFDTLVALATVLGRGIDPLIADGA